MSNKTSLKSILKGAAGILDKGRDAVVSDIKDRVKKPLKLVKKGQEAIFGKGVVEDVYAKAQQIAQMGKSAIISKVTTPQPSMPLKAQAKRDLVQKPLKIVKDVAQGVGYGAAYLNKSLMKGVGGDKLVEKVSNPETEKLLFGRPVGTLQDFSKKTGEYAKSKGSNKAQTKALQGVAIIGSVFAENPLNFGKTPAKALIKNLAKETSEEIIEKELRANIKTLGDDAIKVATPKIAAAKSEKEVVDILEDVAKPQKKITEADKLIAEGKIRVVSRENRDVYQVKKGDQWVNVRDEDSAVKQVTEGRKGPVIPDDLSGKNAELEERLAFKKNEVEEHPGKKLSPLISKKEGQILDFKNPDLAKTPAERQRIIAQNAKKFRTAESALENTKDFDKFDDPDTLRAYVDDFQKKKTDLKSVRGEKKAFLEEVKQIKRDRAILQKSSVPVREEVQSLEKQAQEALGKIDDPIREKIPSLEKIVTQQTPVAKKINVVDRLLRTPEKVMNKIGFGKEMKMLREGYEGYVKELKPNIEKITKWSKTVSKESNQKIFKFLDGQDVVLNSQEKKVAEEIQAWLKEWADRLGLPADNRIASYITHLFEDTLIMKEFDEDLAKIIANKIPGSVYDPFLMKRLGAKGYIEDTWRALDAYVKRATRKVHMDPALDAVKKKAGPSLEMANIEKSQYDFIQDYINNINMRPSNWDTSIDNAVKSLSFFGYKFGQRPVTRVLKALRQMTFRGMLGLNPSSAIRNLSQGANTFAVLGPKYTTIGYAKLFDRQAAKELREVGVLADNFIQDRSINATKKAMEKADKVLFFLFDSAEKINRGAAYFGARAKALGQGKTLKEAQEYAKEIVRKTQFNYGPLDTPVALSGDFAKTITQFGTYSVKQAEFLVDLAKKKEFMALARYGIAGLVFVYTIGQAFGMEPDELIPFYGTFKRGKLPFGEPPSLKFPAELAKAALDTPDKYGNDRSAKQKLEDIGKSGIGLIPGGTQGQKTIRGLKAIKEGGKYTKDGKLQFEQGQTTGKKIQSITFGPYASKEAKEYFDKPAINKEQEKKIKPVFDELQKMKAEGRGEEAIAIFDELSPADQEAYKAYKKKVTTEKNLEGKKSVLPIFQEIRALKEEGKTEEAIAKYDALNEDQQKYYQMVKKDTEEAIKKEASEVQARRSVVKLLVDYSRAYAIDPGNAAKAMFTKEKLGQVKGNLVELERFYGKQFNKPGGSEEYVAKLLEEAGIPQSERGNWNLEHIVPVSAGGGNDAENLELVDRATHDAWTKFDILIGNAVKSKKINRKRAAKIARDFKTGLITAEEVYKQLE